VAAGYDVTLIAQNDRNEVIDGVRILALPRVKNRISRMIGINLLSLIHAVRQKAQIYHFHDPELIPACLILKMFNKKVLYDVHELVLSDIQDKKWLRFSFVTKVTQYLYAFFECLAMRYFDAVILAEDGYLQYFAGTYTRYANKLRIVRNYPILQLIDKAKALDIKKTKPIIIYVGALIPTRSIREMIQMMNYIREEAELWLLGGGLEGKIRKEYENIEGWQYVKHFGFRRVEEIYSYIKAADVALVIYQPVMNNLTTVPVKSFEYMSCSVPFVCSDFPSWRNVFHGASLSASPNDPKDIADQVKILLHNESLRREMGRRGREIIDNNKYSWEMERNKLWAIYHDLSSDWSTELNLDG